MNLRKAESAIRAIGAVLLTTTMIFSAAPLAARDWQEIFRTKTLQVLTVDSGREERGLHRVMMPIDREQALLKSFARRNGLTIEYIRGNSFKALFEMLENDKGDLISANVAETPARKKKYLLSLPFAHTREVVFTASSSPIRGSTPRCLAGKTGWLLPGTTYVENFRNATKKTPNIVFRELAATIPHDALIENVANGQYAYSVLDECDLDAYLAYNFQIRKLFTVKSNVPLVFVASKGNEEMIRRLNAFLFQAAEPEFPVTAPPAEKPEAAPKKTVLKVQKTAPKVPPVDWNVIKKRGYLRMLTTNDAFGCYLHRGQICGFEYELLKRFADEHQISIVTVIPKDFKDMQKYLAEGKGDLIAANFTRSPERIREFPDFTFCTPYGEVMQVVVGRINETISKPADLNGRKFYVRKGNDYFNTLRNLQKKGIKLTIVFIPEDELPVQTMLKVATGEYDLTLVDDAFAKLAISGGTKVKILFPLTEKQSYSWVVRKDAPQLAAAVNAFIKKEHRSAFFNILRNRYYSQKHAQALAPYVLEGKDLTISPYDSIFRKYAKIYDFNWYFLAAQSFQESRFQANLVNPIGATGLMQVMPGTAKDLGVSDLTHPENGIRAGVQYMAQLRDRFDDGLSPTDRLCFTLASYNAGYGHVQDARILAAQLGLNPNVWFDNTEKALLLLEFPQYAAGAKYGYCRASETVPYVRTIMLQSYHYQKLLTQENEKIRDIRKD